MNKYTFSLQTDSFRLPGNFSGFDDRVDLIAYVLCEDRQTGLRYRHTRNFFVDRPVMATFIGSDFCIQQTESVLASDFLEKVKFSYKMELWPGPENSAHWRKV